MTAPLLNVFAFPPRQCDACKEMKDCEATVTEDTPRRWAVGTVCEDCRITNGWKLASRRHRGI